MDLKGLLHEIEIGATGSTSGLNITTVGENSLVVLIVLIQPVASGLFILIWKFFRGIAKNGPLACY